MIQGEIKSANVNEVIPPKYVPTVASGERNRVSLKGGEFKVTLNPNSATTIEKIGKFFSDGVLAFRSSEAAAIQELKQLLTTITPPVPFTFGGETRFFAFYLSREAAQALLNHYQSSSDIPTALSKESLDTIEKIAHTTSEDSNRPKYAIQWPKQIELPNRYNLSGDELRTFLLNLIHPIYFLSNEEKATRAHIHELRHVGQLQRNGSIGAFLDDIYPDSLENVESTPDAGTKLTQKYSASEMDTIFLIKGAAFPLEVLLEMDSILHEIFGELATIESTQHFLPEIFGTRAVDLVSRFLSSYLPEFPKPFIQHDITQLTEQNSPYTLYSPHCVAVLALLFGDTDFNPQTILSQHITGMPEDQLLAMVISKIIEVHASPDAWLEHIKNANLEEKINEAMYIHQKRILGIIKQKIEENDSFILSGINNLEATKEKIDVYLNVS